MSQPRPSRKNSRKSLRRDDSQIETRETGKTFTDNPFEFGRDMAIMGQSLGYNYRASSNTPDHKTLGFHIPNNIEAVEKKLALPRNDAPTKDACLRHLVDLTKICNSATRGKSTEYDYVALFNRFLQPSLDRFNDGYQTITHSAWVGLDSLLPFGTSQLTPDATISLDPEILESHPYLKSIISGYNCGGKIFVNGVIEIKSAEGSLAVAVSEASARKRLTSRTR